MTPARSQFGSSSNAAQDSLPVTASTPKKDIFLIAKDIPVAGAGSYAVTDTLPRSGAIDWHTTASFSHPFPYQSMILPGAMIAYGFAALHSSHLQSLNGDVKEEIWTDNPHKRLGIDTYLMFAPGATVYALNLAGIHGRHDVKDLTILYMMSSLFANVAVFSLKSATHTLRPDGSNYNSFPSGHTAEAFASAELMRQEYKDVSPWYGVAGYAMATATGMLRIYNDKHWLNDVIAGAGFGMASTRLAYWLYPVIQKSFGKGKPVSTIVMPTYQDGSFGLALAHHF